MRLTSLAVAGASVLSVCIAADASASVVAVSSRFVWDYYVNAASLAVGTEAFGGLADGVVSGPVSGSAAGIAWTASAAGGIQVDSGVLMAAAPTTLTFTFSQGVHAVAGNFFGCDPSLAAVPVLFAASMADGTTYSGIATSSSSFTGFVSSVPGQSISSLSITVFNLAGGTSVRPAADNLLFGVVPAPGAVALLAAAGLIGGRRPRVAGA